MEIIEIENTFEFEGNLRKMPKEERDQAITAYLRLLFGIEHKPEMDVGESHGFKEDKFMTIIELLLDTDYNCFEDFAKDLIYHIREERCFD